MLDILNLKQFIGASWAKKTMAIRSFQPSIAGADSADLDSCRVFSQFQKGCFGQFPGLYRENDDKPCDVWGTQTYLQQLEVLKVCPTHFYVVSCYALPMFSFKASRQSRNLQVAVSPSWCAKPQWKLSRSHHFRQPMISRSGKIRLIRRDPSTISIQSLNAKLALCAVAVFPQQPPAFFQHTASLPQHLAPWGRLLGGFTEVEVRLPGIWCLDFFTETSKCWNM